MNAIDAPEEEAAEESPPEVLTSDEYFEAELECLHAIAETFGELDQEARKRVLRWTLSRYLPSYTLAQR